MAPPGIIQLLSLVRTYVVRCQVSDVLLVLWPSGASLHVEPCCPGGLNTFNTNHCIQGNTCCKLLNPPFIVISQSLLCHFHGIRSQVHYCSSLEGISFQRKTADFLWMLLCGAGAGTTWNYYIMFFFGCHLWWPGMLLLLTSFFNMWAAGFKRGISCFEALDGGRYFVSSSLIDLMTYVWGRKNSSARMQADVTWWNNTYLEMLENHQT